MTTIILSDGSEVNKGANLAFCVDLLKAGVLLVFTNNGSLVRCWGPIDSKDVIKIALGQWLSLMNTGEWDDYFEETIETTDEVRNKFKSGEFTLVPTYSFSL